MIFCRHWRNENSPIMVMYAVLLQWYCVLAREGRETYVSPLTLSQFARRSNRGVLHLCPAVQQGELMDLTLDNKSLSQPMLDCCSCSHNGMKCNENLVSTVHEPQSSVRMFLFFFSIFHFPTDALTHLVCFFMFMLVYQIRYLHKLLSLYILCHHNESICFENKLTFNFQHI